MQFSDCLVIQILPSQTFVSQDGSVHKVAILIYKGSDGKLHQVVGGTNGRDFYILKKHIFI